MTFFPPLPISFSLSLIITTLTFLSLSIFLSFNNHIPYHQSLSPPPPSSSQFIEFINSNSQSPPSSPSSSSSDKSSSPSSSYPPDYLSWLSSSTLSSHLSLLSLSTISIPLRINIFLIGISSSLPLPSSPLPVSSPLLEWISTTLPVTWGDIIHMSSDEDGSNSLSTDGVNEHKTIMGGWGGGHHRHGGQKGRKENKNKNNMRGRVQYVFDFHVIRVSDKVNEAVKRVVGKQWRQEDKRNNDNLLTIDTDGLFSVLEDFIVHTQMDNDAANIFLLNPTNDFITKYFSSITPNSNNKYPTDYAYRIGLSEKEIHFVKGVMEGKDGEDGSGLMIGSEEREEKNKVKNVISTFRKNEKRKEEEKKSKMNKKGSSTTIQYNNNNNINSKMSDTDKEKQEEEIFTIRSLEDPPVPIIHFHHSDGQSLPSSSSSPIITDNMDYITLSEEWADDVLLSLSQSDANSIFKNHNSSSSPLSFSSYLSLFSAQNPHHFSSILTNQYSLAECHTSNGVSRDHNILFIDISATPNLSWGPIIGGEGIKSNNTFPSISTVAESIMNEYHEHSEHTEQSAGDENTDENPISQSQIDVERLVVTDRWTSSHCDQYQDMDVMGASAYVREKITHCRELEEQFVELAKWETQLNEMEKHKGEKGGEKEKQKKEKGKIKSLPPLTSPHAFHFITDVEDDSITDDHTTANHHDYDFHLDTTHFLSHLSSSVRQSIRRVVTPTVLSVPSNRHSFSHYATKLSIYLHVLTNHNTFDPMDNNQLIGNLRRAIERMLLPSQLYDLHVETFSLHDDLPLSAALDSSLKTSVIPTLLYDGQFNTMERTFIDSQQLARQMVKEKGKWMGGEGGKEMGEMFGGKDKREEMEEEMEWDWEQHDNDHNNNDDDDLSSFSPLSLLLSSPHHHHRPIHIFLFSLHSDYPLFIDRHYQSVSLLHHNMVIAVQTQYHLWESPLMCNEQPVYWDLQRPLPAIIASLARVIGGVVPNHISYGPGDHGHHSLHHDWSWAITPSPLSYLSPSSLLLTQYELSNMWREYSIQYIESATEIINTAIASLQKIKTTMDNAPLIGYSYSPIDNTMILSPSPSSLAVSTEFTHQSHQIQSLYQKAIDRIEAISLIIKSGKYSLAVKLSWELIDLSIQFREVSEMIRQGSGIHMCKKESLRRIEEEINHGGHQHGTHNKGKEGQGDVGDSSISLSSLYLFSTLVSIMAILVIRVRGQQKAKGE